MSLCTWKHVSGVYEYRRMEIQGYGEDTSLAVLGAVFMLVGQTTPFPFLLTTLPSFQDSLSGPKSFCLAALASLVIIPQQASKPLALCSLRAFASALLSAHGALPTLTQFLVLTCPAPRLDQGSPNMLRVQRELCPSVHTPNSQLLEGRGFLTHSHKSRAGWT